jgi:hypothetical protein
MTVTPGCLRHYCFPAMVAQQLDPQRTPLHA